MKVGLLRALEPTEILKVSNHLRTAQERLASESIFSLVDWVDQAALCWLDRTSAIRKEAEAGLPSACGLSREMIGLVLDELFKPLRRASLLPFLRAELGDPKCLDDFRPKSSGSGFSRAYGPALITHILPGNLPGTAVMSLVLGLLAKSANLIKLSRSQSFLPRLFVRTLGQIRPDLVDAIALFTWDSDQASFTEAALREADLAIVYGSDATVSALRKMTPPSTRLISYGHKLSFGVIARESIEEPLAAEAALDVALYDQRGCLSPHLFYVESGGAASPLDFAHWLAQALDALSQQLPKGKPSAEDAAAIQQLRGSIPLKGGKVLSSKKGLDWTVLYDPDPEFSPSPLSRTIWIKPLADLSELPARIQPLRKSLQAIGIAFPEARQAALVSSLSRLGGCRICPIGKMQAPPLSWHHDGQPRLLPLLRFVDWEKS